MGVLPRFCFLVFLIGETGHVSELSEVTARIHSFVEIKLQYAGITTTTTATIIIVIIIMICNYCWNLNPNFAPWLSYVS